MLKSVFISLRSLTTSYESWEVCTVATDDSKLMNSCLMYSTCSYACSGLN